MKYDKLVRNNIPEIIKNKGKIPIIHIAGGKEFEEKLNEKLREEASEFIKNSTEEELADILEVISAIIDAKNFNKDKIEELRIKKAEERGSFSKRIILDEVND